MTSRPSPQRWANDISLLLNQAFGQERFPVDVTLVAREFSAQRFPNDPISLIAGNNLPGFDGALIRAPNDADGWGIFYNTQVSSLGRINFTLAHEFGHYLLHREDHPDGFSCSQQDIVRWDSEYRTLEREANTFASGLLMPLDDFRRQLDPSADVDFDAISHCADRYKVSLIASILRWLEYTEKRAVLVIARDGFILWARSSKRALRSGAYFRTSHGPIEMPAASGAMTGSSEATERRGVKLPPSVWFKEDSREMVVRSEQYDFTISLVLLPDHASNRWGEDAPGEEDTFTRMTKRS